MVSSRLWGKFAIACAVILPLVGGFSLSAHAVGQIVGTYKISLEVLMPKDNAAFKAGDNVHVTVKSSGFTGVKVTAKDAATGRQEEVTASLVKTEGTGALAPKMWNALWPSSGKKPETYVFTVTGLGGSRETPIAKSVTISVVQPSGPARITFKEPAAGRLVKPGDTLNVAVTATGVDRVEFSVRDLQTGAEKNRPSAHLTGSNEYRTSWSAEGQKQGNYQIIARGLGADEKKLAEESVNIRVFVDPPEVSGASYLTPGEVPPLTGLPKEKALVWLEKSGVKVGSITYQSTPDQRLWGKVIRQSISSGTKTAGPISITVGQK